MSARFVPTWWRGAIVCVWLLHAVQLARSAELPATMQVELSDGRAIAGQIDPATDADRLWLRVERNGVRLTSGMPWSDVLTVRHGERAYNTQEIREALRRGDLRAVGAAPLESPERPPRRPAADQAPGPVRSLEIRAWLANWDGDALPDGLRICVRPLDEQGGIVPVSGQLEVRLVCAVRRGGVSADENPTAEFPEVASASLLVSRRDFGRWGAVYTVPIDVRELQALGIGREGIVVARLGVPGQGTFDAVRDDVVVRPVGALRDLLELNTGSRLLPVEE